MSARDGLVQARLALGKKLEEANQPNEAILQYEHAYKISPNDETTRRCLANIWQERGDAILTTEGLVAVLEPYQKALDFDPSNAIAERVRLKLDDYIHQAETDQKYDQAIKAVEQLQKLGLIDQTELNSRLAAVWLERGHAALAATGLTSAVEAYQQALTFDHQDVTTRSISSKLEEYTQQAETSQNYDKAIEAIHQLRNLLPKDASMLDLEIAFWTRRGDSLAKEGEGAEAIQAYQHALELSPNEAILTKKLRAVSTEWEKLLVADRLFNQAMVAHQTGDWTTAEKGWLQLLKIDVLDYKGRGIATLLAEASENNKKCKAHFEGGWQVYQVQDWSTAELAWQQLIDAGVETFDGQQIQSLLAQIREKRLEQKDYQAITVDTKEPEPSLAVASLGWRNLPWYAWLTVGMTAFILIVISVVLYQILGNPAAITATNSTISGRQIQITFTSDRDGNWEIYALGSDGVVERLTNNPASDQAPTWSPDGSKLAFSSNRDDGNWEVYTLDSDSVASRFTNNGVNYNPDWEH